MDLIRLHPPSESVLQADEDGPTASEKILASAVFECPLSSQDGRPRPATPAWGYDNCVEIFEKFNWFLKKDQFRFYWVIIFDKIF